MKSIDEADRFFGIRKHLFASGEAIVHVVQTALDHPATKPGHVSPPLPSTPSQESFESFSWHSSVDFRLVKKEDDALHFGGISFYRRDDGSMDGYIVMKDGDEVREHHLKYERR